MQWGVSSGILDGVGTLLFAANLNLGHTSRGKLGMDVELNVNVEVNPYFNDDGDHDFKALVVSAETLLDRLTRTMPNATMLYPPPGTSLEDYLREVSPPFSLVPTYVQYTDAHTVHPYYPPSHLQPLGRQHPYVRLLR
jgi:hypothetical protein